VDQAVGDDRVDPLDLDRALRHLLDPLERAVGRDDPDRRAGQRGVVIVGLRRRGEHEPAVRQRVGVAEVQLHAVRLSEVEVVHLVELGHVDLEVARERVHHLGERQVDQLALAALGVAALEEREAILGHRHALDVQPAGQRPLQVLVEVREVDGAREAAQRSVRVERPGEPVVAALPAAGAER
jgi:hypothetical protein